MIRELIDKEKDCDLSQIHIDQLIYSQAGVLAVKRRHLAYRLALDLKRGKRVPKKRVAPEQLKSLLIWKEVVIMEEMADVSKKLWDCKNRDAKQLREAMNPLMTQLIISREIANAFTFPVRTLRYIRKKFYGDQGSI
jgi:hypothetical protein